MCGFDIFMYCNMIVTIALASTYHVPELSFFVVESIKIEFLSNFEVHNSVSLTIGK